VPGDSSLVIRVKGVDIGIAICEDIWHSLADLAARTPRLVLVPNGSPYERNKDDVRLALVQKRAKEVGAPLAYVNMTGGQDDLVFDGDTIVVDAKGSVISRAAQFEDQLLVVDIESATQTSKPDVVISENGPEASGAVAPAVALRMSDHQEIWNALVMGLRDYVSKNKFRSVVVGLSGGIDSALVAAIAVDALGAKCVNGVAMPSKYSSDHSVEDATAFAANTGIHFRTVSIEPMVQSFMESITLKGLAAENIQARVRGTTLMGISNQEGHLVLATGNKSELAVGYSTLYGDAVGGFAPIKDIYKSDVWALARWRNEQAVSRNEVAPIPVRSIEKEPSAELRPDQKDSDSLPEYELLDQLLTRYVDGDQGSAALIAAGFDSALVMRVIGLVDKAEYKRRQYPPGTKVSARAFGKDRRLPMTSRWSEA
jgi:NAD+ synthase (glutamine-hydrolysing)